MAFAHPLMHELLCHSRSQIGPVLGGDFLQHHIQACNATSTGKTVPVNFKQFRPHVQVWIFFRKTVQVFPVDGAAIAVQQARMGQYMGPGTDCANMAAFARPTAKPAKDRIVLVNMRINARTQDDIAGR